jgi:hypothetical protein
MLNSHMSVAIPMTYAPIEESCMSGANCSG